MTAKEFISQQKERYEKMTKQPQYQTTEYMKGYWAGIIEELNYILEIYDALGID